MRVCKQKACVCGVGGGRGGCVCGVRGGGGCVGRCVRAVCACVCGVSEPTPLPTRHVAVAA